MDRRSMTETVTSGSGDPLDDVRTILQSLSSEVLLLITPDGEAVGSRAAIDFDLVSDRAEDERTGRYVGSVIHPEDLIAALSFIEQVRRYGHAAERFTFRALLPDGTWAEHEASGVDPARHPMLPGVVLRVRPVEDPAERSALDGVERFQSLASVLPLGILSADRRGSVVFCNDQAEQILNRPVTDLIGRGWELAIHPDDRSEVREAADLAAREGLTQQAVFRVETGLFQRWASAKFVPLGLPPAHTGWIATLDDVTELRRQESHLSHQATHDPLTGLPNRILLEDRLRQSCARLRRGSESLTVMFIDLDDFKDVNDTYGHAAGDEVLITVGRRLNRAVRDVDTVTRFAGDEFVVICEALDDSHAVELEHRLRTAIREPIRLSDGEVRIGASIGVVTTREATADATDLLAMADSRMYQQKRNR